MDIIIKKLNTLVLAVSALVVFSTFGSAANAMDMKSWQKAVVKKVSSEQRYPRAAMAREIEGRARVRLVVDAAGNITSHEILEETGQSILDKEIPKLVDRLNPLPSLPDGKTELSFVLPLSWTLN